MTDNSFTQFVPGFDFLQGLVKNAGSALPGIGQWVAPTLNPEELGKRIDELRTVQFWLEQNARMLGATIQAMEVQRMTLSTLKSMNVPLADLQNALKMPTPESAPAASAWTTMSADMMAAAAKISIRAR
ncbi:PhaM family polyhydroxyalkanoate granule multifunctional regulatory protein [Roseateles sp. GG27B]